MEYEHIQFNPARGRRRRLKVAQPARTWLEPEQIKPLLDATLRGLRGGKTMPDPRMRILFATGICTGLRIGELLALRWRDVNLAQGRLTVIDSKTDAGKGREIDLWPELREELAVYKADARYAEPVDYVFATATGKADTRWNIAKRLKRAVERANEALADSGHAADPGRAFSALAAAHVRIAALPTRREPRLRDAPDGPHRPQARAAHLHQGHGRATPPRPRRPARRRARRRHVDAGPSWGRAQRGCDRERRGRMKAMATKRQNSARRAASPAPRFITVNGRRVRLNKPAETDPKKRVEAVRRATTRIKTTARIDTITLGRD